MMTAKDVIEMCNKEKIPVEMLLEDNDYYYILEDITDEAYTRVNKSDGTKSTLWIWDWPTSGIEEINLESIEKSA